jgi:hypothetical protein
MRLSRCYATLLADCEGRLSLEHPVSENVLDYLAGGSGEVRVHGRSSQRDLEHGDLLPVRTLGRRVLCERHNGTLGPLDAVGGRFVRADADAKLHLAEQNSGDFHALFNGYDLERWLLKVLCGIHHRQPIPGSESRAPWRVPLAWLRILFHGAPFPDGAGLYIPKSPVSRPRSESLITTERTYGQVYERSSEGLPIVRGVAEKLLVGLRLCVFGRELQLRMHRPIDEPDLIFRVRMFRYTSTGESGNAFLHLGWDDHPPTFHGKVAARTTASISRGAHAALDRRRRLKLSKTKGRPQ